MFFGVCQLGVRNGELVRVWTQKEQQQQVVIGRRAPNLLSDNLQLVTLTKVAAHNQSQVCSFTWSIRGGCAILVISS